MFKAFLYLLPFILVPTAAMQFSNSPILALASTLAVSLFLNLLVTKQSNFEAAKRGLINSLISAKHRKDLLEAKISIDAFLVFLNKTGLHSTHKKTDMFFKCCNVNVEEEQKIDYIIQYCSDISLDWTEQAQSIMRL